MMNEVEVKNAQMTLASVRSDTLLATAELAVLLTEKKELKKSIETSKAEDSKAKEEIAAAHKELEDERARMKMERDAHDKWVERSKAELGVLKRQKKEAMTELARLNDWIFSGEEAKKKLEAEIREMEARAAYKASLEEAIVLTLEEKEQAEQERNAVRLETSLLLDSAEAKLVKINAERAEEESKLALATENRQKEESAAQDAKNERARIKRDVDVVVTRLEKKFGEAYPGLRLTL